MRNQLSDSSIKVLADLAVMFREKNIFWILTGSSSLVLQGVDVFPHDLDIIISKDDISKVDSLLAEHRVKYPDYSSTDRFRSYYGKYQIDDVKIDIMAEFQYKKDDGNWSKINQKAKAVGFSWNGLTFKVLPLEVELVEYGNKFGREKAIAIRKVLDAR